MTLNENYQAYIIVLNRDRDHLYDRINNRVDLMFEQGLLDEVEALHKMGYTKEITSMQGIGYKEILDYFEGLISLEDAKASIKQSSRRYAKRQITWFKRYPKALWLDIDKVKSLDDQLKIIREFMASQGFEEKGEI